MLVDVQEKPTVSPCGKNAALLSKSNEQQQVPWAKHSINRACAAYFSLLRYEQTTVIKNISVRPAYVCSCCYL